MPNRGGSHEQHKAGEHGRKHEGGQRSEQQHAQDDKNKSGGGERGGSGNPERALEAGRKGGQS